MADITWGSRQEWLVESVDDGSDGAPRYFGSCQIDTNKFVIAYALQATGKSDNRQGKLVIATVSGDEVTFSDNQLFYGGTDLSYASEVRVSKLDTDKFVVSYVNNVDLHLYARVGTVSGITVTMGAEVDLFPEAGDVTDTYYHCHHTTVLSPTKFVISYGRKSGTTYTSDVSICTVANRTITAGGHVTFYAGRLKVSHMCKLDTDKLLLVFSINGSLNGVVGTVAGLACSFGSTYYVEGDYSPVTFAVQLISDGKALAAYNTGGTVTAKGLMRVLTITGNAISRSDAVEFQAAAPAGQGPGNISIMVITSDIFVLVYNDSSPTVGARGASKYSTIADSTITFGDKEVWETPYLSRTQAFALTPAKLAVVYRIGAGAHYAKIGTPMIHSLSITTNPATLVTSTTATLNGTLDDDGGEPCDCSFQYGLTTGYGTNTSTQSKTIGQSFEQAITDLLPSTTYHFRAKGTNSEGTGYGEDLTFTTLGGVFPSVATTRVSSLVHRWVPGSFTLEMVLGGITSEFGLIIPTGKPAPTIPTLPVCQSDEVLTWSLEQGYYCMKVSDIPPGKY